MKKITDILNGNLVFIVTIIFFSGIAWYKLQAVENKLVSHEIQQTADTIFMQNIDRKIERKAIIDSLNWKALKDMLDERLPKKK